MKTLFKDYPLLGRSVKRGSIVFGISTSLFTSRVLLFLHGLQRTLPGTPGLTITVFIFPVFLLVTHTATTASIIQACTQKGVVGYG